MKILLASVLTIIAAACGPKSVDVKLRFNDNGIDEINTFNNTWTRKYRFSETTTHFDLTEKEQERINYMANEIDLENIISPGDTCVNNPPKEITIEFPANEYELEFKTKDGQKRILKWGDNICQYEQIFKLQVFADSLKRMIAEKTQIKNLKETDIIRL